jgi:hypothetical protein
MLSGDQTSEDSVFWRFAALVDRIGYADGLDWLRRNRFVFPSALENKFSALPEKQNPQRSLRVSCSSGRLDESRRCNLFVFNVLQT